MSYYDPWADYSEEDLAWLTDPSNPEAMFDYTYGQGEYGPGGLYEDINAPMFDPGQQAGYGLISPTQPSGKAMTPSNITGAISAYRSGMFDPLFQGLGGSEGFTAEAFAPQITQNPIDSPINDYLRNPTSVEGLIADELRNGGTASTAIRKLRQMLTANDQAIADQLFQGDTAQSATFKQNLLLELPARYDDNVGQYVEMTPDGAGVDWEGSVRDIATRVEGEWAETPPVGVSGPKYNAEGEQISAGGTVDWQQDPTTGQWSLVETVETLPPLAQKYAEAGLPSPFEEYTTEDFLSPDVLNQQGIYSNEIQPAYQEAMARLLADPTFNPVSPETRAAAAGELWQPMPGDENVTNFPSGPNEPAGPVVNAPGPSDTQTTVGELLPHDQGAWDEWMYNTYPTLDADTQTATRDYLDEIGLGDRVAPPAPTVLTRGEGANAETLTAPQVLPDDQGAWREWLGTTYPTLNTDDQRQVADYLATIPGAPLPSPELTAEYQYNNPYPPQGGGAYYPEPVAGGGFLADAQNFVQARQPPALGGAGGGMPGNAVQMRNVPAAAAMQAYLRRSGEPEPPAPPPYGGRQEFELAQQQQTPPYTYSGGYTPPRDVQREAATAGGGLTPPTPSYGGRQEYELAQQQQQPTPPYTYSGGYTPPRDVQREAAMASAMVRAAAAPPPYIPSIITGERQTPTSAPQSEQAGRGVRTGEAPARRPMHELEGEGRAVQLDQGGITQRRFGQGRELRAAHHEERNRAYGAEHGAAWGRAYALRQQGVRPLDQALMARRLVMMSAGMPTGRLPGT